MMKIVGVGANVYDTLAVLPNYPREDTKIKAESMIAAGGGPCATGIVAAAKLGESTAFLGCVSDDAIGDYLIGDFKRYGVNTGYIRKKAGCRAFTSFVLLSKHAASRTVVFDRGTLPPLELDEDMHAAVQSAEILMVDGNDMAAALEAAKIAKESGTKVLYDAGGLYENVESLLPYADILIPSEEFALGFTKAANVEEAARVLYQRFQPEVVVITQGKDGGVMYDGNSIRRYGAFKVNAVDTNGAGDVFHGAFAFAVTRGYDYYRCCVFSSAVSALKCTRIGAREGIPSLCETIEFLRGNGYEFEKDVER